MNGKNSADSPRHYESAEAGSNVNQTYSCGYCGTEVAVGEKCFCRDTTGQVGRVAPNPMSFESSGRGIRVTFQNGWSVLATEADLMPSERVNIQMFMPQGLPVKAFGREEFVVNCNDLAVILMQTSQIPADVEASEEYATHSYEAMMEGLMFGVAA